MFISVTKGAMWHMGLMHCGICAMFRSNWYNALLAGAVDGDTHLHDDVIKLKYFPRYWPFVRGNHRSMVNSHQGQWRGALMFSLAWINGWVSNREAGDLRRHRTYYDVIVMSLYGALGSCVTAYDACIINSLPPGRFEHNFRQVIFKIISVTDGWGILQNCSQMDATWP